MLMLPFVTSIPVAFRETVVKPETGMDNAINCIIAEQYSAGNIDAWHSVIVSLLPKTTFPVLLWTIQPVAVSLKETAFDDATVQSVDAPETVTVPVMLRKWQSVAVPEIVTAAQAEQ